MREHVESGSRQPSVAERVHERLFVDHGAAPDVHDDRAAREQREGLAAEEPACRRRARQRDDDCVGARQKLVQPVGRVELVEVRDPAGRALDPDRPRAEGARQADDLAADPSQAEHEHRPVAQLADRVVIPTALGLVAKEPRQILHEREQAEQSELGERTRVDAG